jgi:hypothetical protein
MSSLPNHTQLYLLWDHLISVGSITPVEAHELYQVRSFHRRMSDLAEQGVKFRKERRRDHTGRQYVKYHYAGFNA